MIITGTFGTYAITFCVSLLILRVLNFFKNESIFSKFLWSVIVSLPLALLAAARLGVGTDFYSYEYVYKVATTLFNNGFISAAFSNTEPLYILLEYIGFLLAGKNYHFFLFIISLCTLVPVVMFILECVPKKVRVFSWLVYLLVFFLTSFNIIRQMLAVSIVIYGFKYLLNKQNSKYIFFVIVASLIHNSSVIALLFCFLNLDVKLASRITINQLLSLIVLILSPIAFLGVMTFGPSLPVIGVYFKNYSVVQNASNSYFILLTILPVVPALFFKAKILAHENGLVIYNTIWTTIILAMIGLFNDYAFRLLYYPSSLIVFTYPYIISESKSSKNLLLVSLAIYTCIVFYVTTFTFGFNDVSQYENIPFELIFLKQ